MSTIRILGLDPGLARMGWGVVEMTGTRLVHVAHGVLTSDAKADLGRRLMVLHEGLAIVIATQRPAAIAVEQAFVHKDPSAALKLGHARAVALLASRSDPKTCRRYARRLAPLASIHCARRCGRCALHAPMRHYKTVLH